MTSYAYFALTAANPSTPYSSINVSLGQIQSKWGTFAFSVRSSAVPGGYNQGNYRLNFDVCMTIAYAPAVYRHAQFTFQLMTTIFKTDDNRAPNDRFSNRLGSRDVHQTVAITSGVIVTAVLPIEHSTSFVNPEFTIDHLSITIQVPTDSFPNAIVLAPRLRDLFNTINDPNLCDCTLQLGNGLTLQASKAILANASPAFFGTMFRRPEWTASADGQQAAQGHVKFETWSIKAVLPCLAHMYFGWLPTTSTRLTVANSAAVGDAVVAAPPAAAVGDALEDAAKESALAVETAAYALMDWNEVLELAQMLELGELVAGVKEAMISVLEK